MTSSVPGKFAPSLDKVSLTTTPIGKLQEEYDKAMLDNRHADACEVAIQMSRRIIVMTEAAVRGLNAAWSKHNQHLKGEE